MNRTWTTGTWLEKPYMEHLPMTHEKGLIYAGVFGIRSFDDKRWKVTHVPSGMRLGWADTGAKAKQMVKDFLTVAPVEFWSSIKTQPMKATSTPEFIQVMQACKTIQSKYE